MALVYGSAWRPLGAPLRERTQAQPRRHADPSGLLKAGAALKPSSPAPDCPGRSHRVKGGPAGRLFAQTLAPGVHSQRIGACKNDGEDYDRAVLTVVVVAATGMGFA